MMQGEHTYQTFKKLGDDDQDERACEFLQRTTIVRRAPRL